jgi:hypothetical protein
MTETRRECIAFTIRHYDQAVLSEGQGRYLAPTIPASPPPKTQMCGLTRRSSLWAILGSNQ